MNTCHGHLLWTPAADTCCRPLQPVANTGLSRGAEVTRGPEGGEGGGGVRGEGGGRGGRGEGGGREEGKGERKEEPSGEEEVGTGLELGGFPQPPLPGEQVRPLGDHPLPWGLGQPRRVLGEGSMVKG